MPTWTPTIVPSTNGDTQRRLEKIADILDCPVDAFAPASSPLQLRGELAEAAELLSLYVLIGSAEDRQRALVFVRELVEGGKQGQVHDTRVGGPEAS